ncbi:MAG: DUF2784 domain-containing protein [Thermodesulfovibrionales bacterium]|nr:DUF2784 domain-containing protein [Thermodesulfovibrionales bacterium]
MPYKILADIVVIIHFLWIVFLIFGAFLGVKYRAVKIFHISGLIFTFIIQIFDWYCPLTHLEVWLRSKHDPALAYTGSFIPHYIEKIVYIELPHYSIFVLTVILCGFNAWFYIKKKKNA